MEIVELFNENLSKKMGLGLGGMYFVSKCTDTIIAGIIAGIAVVGIVAQSVIDWRKLKDNEKQSTIENRK